MSDLKSDFDEEQLRMVASNWIEPTRAQQRDMAVELNIHRATMKRLEEWAELLDLEGRTYTTTTWAIAAELRNRMNGGHDV